MFGLFSSAEDDTRARNPLTADPESSLLSGVASWFGYGAPSNPVYKEDVAFDTADAEQDWVLVDKRDRRSAVGLPWNESLDFEDSDDERAESDEYRSLREADLAATATSTYQMAYEDGWVMTPRPCFTQRSNKGPVEYHISEDLLIEHPSMSVYQKLEMEKQILLDVLENRKAQGRKGLLPPDSRLIDPRPMTFDDNHKDFKKSRPWATQTTDGCQHRLENKLELMARVKEVKSSQRKQQQKENQGLNRKHLQRQNKNSIMQSQGKRANRNNRARNTSGAMHSRIPQRRR